MILSALIAKAIPYLIGLMALVGVYWRGHHAGRAAEGKETLQRYARERQAIDEADLGTGATDAERAKRLRQFAEKP
jgi:hypothetical protein